MISARTNEEDMVSIVRAYTDVTERLKHSHDALAREVCRLREEVHQKNKELRRRERLAALGEMAAGVAHEIRNPLGGIRLYASLLIRDLSDRPPQLEIVKKLSAGVVNLERIVGDILAFAVEAEPNRQDLRLGKILEGAVAQTAPQAEAIRVHVDVDDVLALEEVFCDPAQIERALINLLLNAIDAAGSGGCVRVRAGDRGAAHDGCGLKDPASGLCRIAVEDNGPGLPTGVEHRVFDPFFTRKSAGTGLGLAIVHRIAESNGGGVQAQNRHDGGAVFVLSVPRKDETVHSSSA